MSIFIYTPRYLDGLSATRTMSNRDIPTPGPPIGTARTVRMCNS